MGYLTQVEVPLEVVEYTRGYRRVPATDLDVLAVRFDSGLLEDRLVVECKSGTHGATAELLRLAGVARFYSATDSWLVKTEISDNARQVARRLDIRPVSSSELEALLAGWGIDPRVVDDVGLKRLEALRRLLAGLGDMNEAQKILRYSIHDVWLREYWESIHNLLFSLGRDASRGFSPSSDEHCYLVFRCMVLLTLCIVRMTAQIVGWKALDCSRGVELFLYGGPTRRRERERLLDKLRQSVPSEYLAGEQLDPAFAEDLKRVIGALIRNPSEVGEVLPCLQNAQNAYYLGTASGLTLASGAPSYSDLTVKLAKDCVEFGLKAAGLEAAFAEAFLAS
jgi:hypothetical protein